MWPHFKNSDSGIDTQLPITQQSTASASEIDLLSHYFDTQNLSLEDLRTEILNQALENNRLTTSGDPHQDLYNLEEHYRLQTAELLALDENTPWQEIAAEFETRVIQQLKTLHPSIHEQCVLEMKEAGKQAVSLQSKNKFIAQREVLQKYIEA